MRAHAGIANLIAFAKIEISGSDAKSFLNRIESNKLPQKVGSVSLTYMIMDNGRIEAEATIVKLGDNHYYLVYAAAREAALLNWMEQELGNTALAPESVKFKNVSEDFGVIMLAGPASRSILSECTNASLDNASFRWLST